MKLLSKITQLAKSPQGRKAIGDARARFDTPANRAKLQDLLGKARGRGGRSGPGSTGPAV